MNAAVRIAALVLAAVALAVFAAAGSAPAAREGAAEASVLVFFTKGEQLATVRRPVPADADPLAEAVKQLLAGPSADEVARGFRSSIPAGVRLNGTSVTGGVARIDVSPEFATGSHGDLHARLAQLVFSVTQFHGVGAVRVAVDGRELRRLGAIALEPPPGRRALAPAPSGGAPAPAAAAPGTASRLVRSIQQRLIELSYLPPNSADGIAGPQTRHAILAFQGWEGVARDGRVTAGLRRLLGAAEAPDATYEDVRYIEVDLERQVALLVRNGRVVRTVHVSTGAPSSPTPRGDFRVFRKEARSWSIPYRVWLPWASYFTGGVAFHESADVPTYPASHGCVRISAADARAVYAFATLGTRVVVG